jgi:hypothetical protein
MEKALPAEGGSEAELRDGTACAARVKKAGGASADVGGRDGKRLRKLVRVADGWRGVNDLTRRTT